MDNKLCVIRQRFLPAQLAQRGNLGLNLYTICAKVSAYIYN